MQYWVLTFASLWLLQVEKTLPRAFVLLVFVWMCYSLFVQGAALEGRAYRAQAGVAACRIDAGAGR